MTTFQIIQIIYVIGMIIALFIAIYEFKSLKNKNEKVQIEMIAPMILLSWITVLAYVYGKIRHKNQQIKKLI